MRNYKVLHIALIVTDILAFIAAAMGARALAEEVTKSAVVFVALGISWALLSLFLLHPWESLLEDIRSIRNKLETKSPDGQHK